MIYIGTITEPCGGCGAVGVPGLWANFVGIDSTMCAACLNARGIDCIALRGVNAYSDGGLKCDLCHAGLAEVEGVWGIGGNPPDFPSPDWVMWGHVSTVLCPRCLEGIGEREHLCVTRRYYDGERFAYALSFCPECELYWTASGGPQRSEDEAAAEAERLHAMWHGRARVRDEP